MNKEGERERVARTKKRMRKRMYTLGANAPLCVTGDEVFLSFGGPDVGTGFVDLLSKRLLDAGVHVSSNDCALPVCEEKGTEQLLSRCKITIPIISEGYASSTGCLRELAAIMDCRRRRDTVVLPIFYEVDVVDLGRRRGYFDEAFRKHEMKCSSEEILAWKEALTSVAGIRGWISQTTADGHEGELVQMVVAKVLSELKTIWIQQLPLFIRSVYLFFMGKKRSESKCQVFLTFRGPDTRHNLADYLYVSLVASGIGVFNHDDPSLIGKDFSNEISSAIDHCRISIPILSPNYSSSSWCLDELARMVDCKRTKGQEIMPIFYKVDPLHVRDLSHCFGESMLPHRELVNESTYDRWKRALREVGSLEGWVSEKVANGHEEVLVKQVVKKVLRLLKIPQTHDPPSLSTE